MKVNELKVTNDLAKLLAEVHVSGTGSNARKALENLDGVSISYSSTMKRIPILKDLKSGVSIELSEKLELVSLTQLSKELGFGGTAYQAGNLLNKNFMATRGEVKKRTSKEVFEECFDVERLKEECSDTLSELVESFIDLESLSEQDRKTLETQLNKIGLAFIHAEELYDVIKLDKTLTLVDYFLDEEYEEYSKLIKQESRFDCLPREVQVIDERDDGYILIKSKDYMSVEDFIGLQVKLKDVAAEDTLQISKTVAWADDGITVDSVAVTATLKLK